MKKHLIEAKRLLKEESDYFIPANSKIYSKIINDLMKPFKKISIDKVMAIDMKGLMYGPIVANKLKTGFVPILTGNKIQKRELVIKKEFIDYSGKVKSIEIFKSSVKQGDKILLVDDWFDSGNTGKSVIQLIESLGGKVVGISVIFNQLSKENEEFFNKYNFHYLIKLGVKK